MSQVERIEPRTAGNIRAAAVISTVSQAVEELLLNSIDAGATSVEIRVELPSYRLSVTDNGRGIPSDKLQALVGTTRATSKVSTINDIHQCRTYGFRGEALHSLGLSSLLEIQSRCAGLGSHAKVVRDGEIMHFGPSRSPSFVGTIVTLRDIFFKWPVRRRAMNQVAEVIRIKEIVARAALVNCSIAITVLDAAKSRPLLRVQPSSTVVQAFSVLFSSDKLSMTQKVVFEFQQFRIVGYLSPPSSSACHWSKEFQELFPVFVLNIECPPGEVDVTIESDKTFVAFADWSTAKNAGIAMLLAFLAHFEHAVPGCVVHDLRRSFHKNKEASSWVTASPGASCSGPQGGAREISSPPPPPMLSPMPMQLEMPDVGLPSPSYGEDWMGTGGFCGGVHDKGEVMAFHDNNSFHGQGFLYPSLASTSSRGLSEYKGKPLPPDWGDCAQQVRVSTSPHFSSPTPGRCSGDSGGWTTAHVRSQSPHFSSNMSYCGDVEASTLGVTGGVGACDTREGSPSPPLLAEWGQHPRCVSVVSDGTLPSNDYIHPAIGSLDQDRQYLQGVTSLPWNVGMEGDGGGGSELDGDENSPQRLEGRTWDLGNGKLIGQVRKPMNVLQGQQNEYPADRYSSPILPKYRSPEHLSSRGWRLNGGRHLSQEDHPQVLRSRTDTSQVRHTRQVRKREWRQGSQKLSTQNSPALFSGGDCTGDWNEESSEVARGGDSDSLTCLFNYAFPEKRDRSHRDQLAGKCVSHGNTTKGLVVGLGNGTGIDTRIGKKRDHGKWGSRPPPVPSLMARRRFNYQRRTVRCRGLGVTVTRPPSPSFSFLVKEVTSVAKSKSEEGPGTQINTPSRDPEEERTDERSSTVENGGEQGLAPLRESPTRSQLRTTGATSCSSPLRSTSTNPSLHEVGDLANGSLSLPGVHPLESEDCQRDTPQLCSSLGESLPHTSDVDGLRQPPARGCKRQRVVGPTSTAANTGDITVAATTAATTPTKAQSCSAFIPISGANSCSYSLDEDCTKDNNISSQKGKRVAGNKDSEREGDADRYGEAALGSDLHNGSSQSRKKTGWEKERRRVSQIEGSAPWRVKECLSKYNARGLFIDEKAQRKPEVWQEGFRDVDRSVNEVDGTVWNKIELILGQNCEQKQEAGKSSGTVLKNIDHRVETVPRTVGQTGTCTLDDDSKVRGRDFGKSEQIVLRPTEDNEENNEVEPLDINSAPVLEAADKGQESNGMSELCNQSEQDELGNAKARDNAGSTSVGSSFYVAESGEGVQGKASDNDDEVGSNLDGENFAGGDLLEDFVEADPYDSCGVSNPGGIHASQGAVHLLGTGLDNMPGKIHLGMQGTTDRKAERPIAGVTEASRNELKAGAGAVAITLTPEELDRAQVIGQAGRKFILLRAMTGAVLCVDQHAADERVKLEDLERQVYGPARNERNVKKFALNPAEVSPLTRTDAELVEQHRKVLVSWNFDIEVEETIGMSFPQAKLHSVPEDLFGFLHHLRERVEPGAKATGVRPPQIQHILNYKACHSAIRFGDLLTNLECVELMSRLATCKLPFFCAHGRPSVVPLCVLGEQVGGHDLK